MTDNSSSTPAATANGVVEKDLKEVNPKILSSPSTTEITPPFLVQEEKEEKEDEKRDDEGLRLKYDVIVCGTGLVQSILASALSRAGKSVLHCDGADHYGELDSVWNLPFLQETIKSHETKKNDDTTTTTKKETKEQQGETAVEEPSLLSPLTLTLAQNCNTAASVRILSTKETTSFPLRVGTQVQTPYGLGVVTRLPNDESSSSSSQSSLAVSYPTNWMAYFGIPQINIVDDGSSSTSSSVRTTLDDYYTSYLKETHKVQSVQSIEAEQILYNDRAVRSFALDVTPALVLASGRAVQGLLASGVSEYMEFKTLEGLLWLDDTTTTTKEKKNHQQPKMSRVPCSKGDVFNTKLLAPMDKRRLMKFMQLSMDYATSRSVQEELDELQRQQQKQQQEQQQEETIGDREQAPAEEVQSLNERHLNQGRSLARPQNKAVSTQELQVLQQCIAEGNMSFDTYLSEKHKLSPQLRGLVRYALAMETEETSTTLLDGMTSLRHHLQALGRYGTTAFLVPMYGSGELSQAFCRSAAVFGATYLLRRSPFQVMMAPTADDDDDDNGKNLIVQGVKILGDQSEESDSYTPKSSRQEKTILCSHVVVSAESIQGASSSLSTSSSSSSPPTKGPSSSSRRLLRRISILRGKLMQDPSDSSTTKQEQRHLIVIPPKTKSIGNTYAIHGIALDDSVNVAPNGCTILHLTTMMDVKDINHENPRNDDDDAAILQKACELILNGAGGGGGENTGGEMIDELYHVSFCHDFVLASDAHDDDEQQPLQQTGLHVCHRSGMALTADTAFQQAQEIFSTICPGSKFLGLSEELDTVVKDLAADRGDDDDERVMLDRAVGIIEEATTTTTAPVAGEPPAAVEEEAPQISSNTPKEKGDEELKEE